MRDRLGNTDFSQSVQFIVHLEERFFGNISAGSRNCLRGYSLAYSCSDGEFGMERGLRFGDVLHDTVDNSESIVFCEEELDIVIATRHNRELLVEAVEKLVVSFDMHDSCGLVEGRLQYNFSWKSKATFLFPIFEASR